MKKQPTNTKKPKQPLKENLLMKYAWLWLSLAVLLVYTPTVNLGFTELDDTIFIKEMGAYNKDASNLFTSFRRGVFSDSKGTYYRPLLLNSFIINAAFSKQQIGGYHIVNILLHLGAVLLLFVLLQKLGIKKMAAFCLSMLFAVHVVLTQAVTWIPGRNDTLLALFVFSFFIAGINYGRSPERKWLIFQFVALLAALFTKETAVFALPVAWLLCIFLPQKSWKDTKAMSMYGVWIAGALIYFLARSQANLEQSGLAIKELLGSALGRFPVILAYLGKVFLPFNLSVFPMLQDMTLLYGFLTLAGLGVLVYFSRKNNWRMMLVGASTFVLFLIPALLVPDAVNNQDFEHRLYVPMLGMLLLLSETVLLKNNWSERHLAMGTGALVLVLALMNWYRQPLFNDPISFWKAAVESSPNSAYANMMLAARLDNTDMQRAKTLMQKAYDLDPNQKYINYYQGSLLVTEGKLLESEPYFLAEIKNSDYYKCYSPLAEIAFKKQDPNAAIQYLEKYLAVDGADVEMNNNLLMLYLQSNQLEKARDQAAKMRLRGLTIPADFQGKF